MEANRSFPATSARYSGLMPSRSRPSTTPPRVALDQAEGEHAREVLDEAVAPVPVRLDDDLGVAGREEPVARPLELAPQLVVVVDAAVEGDRDPELGVDHRLGRPLGQVDDLQATVAERHRSLRPQPRPVGAAGGHRVGHARHGDRIGRHPREIELTTEPTHASPTVPTRRAGMTPRTVKAA